MHTSSAISPRIAAAFIALGMLAGSALAEPVTGADIPKDTYYKDPLTKLERDAIAEEENVSPNDGSPSMPDPADRGVIPVPAEVIPDRRSEAADDKPVKVAESEADKILDDAQKNYPVTQSDLERCMGQWDPETQMTKEQWARSCRTTLQYFPNEGN